MGHVTESLDF